MGGLARSDQAGWGGEFDRLRARVVDSQQAGSERIAQTVQVLEGYSAFIRVGEARPVRNRQVVRTMVNGQLVDRVIESTDYVEAATGFNVRPRLQGDRVTLDIDPQRSLARWDDVRGRSAKARPLHFEAPTGWRLPSILDRLRAELADRPGPAGPVPLVIVPELVTRATGRRVVTLMAQAIEDELI